MAKKMRMIKIGEPKISDIFDLSYKKMTPRQILILPRQNDVGTYQKKTHPVNRYWRPYIFELFQHGLFCVQGPGQSHSGASSGIGAAYSRDANSRVFAMRIGLVADSVARGAY